MIPFVSVGQSDDILVNEMYPCISYMENVDMSSNEAQKSLLQDVHRDDSSKKSDDGSSSSLLPKKVVDE